MKNHPAAEKLPMLSEVELRELGEDIKAHGQILPIIVSLDDQVLDGRNRLAACKLVGVEPYTLVWDGEGSAVDYVRSMNLRRRHLTQDQKAAIGNELAEFAAAQRPHPPPGRTKGYEIEKIAAEVGVGTRTMERVRRVKKEAPELHKKVLEGKLPLKRAEAEIKRADQKKAIAKYVPPKGRYSVILTDPSWPYRQKLKALGRELPYPPQTLEQIKAKPPPADTNCTIYLCSTNAHLPQAFDVLEAWGFRYTGAMITWGKVDKSGKPRRGMGHWLIGATEHVLIAVKGKPLHEGWHGTSLLLAERGANSEKPDELYALIEKLSPAAPKLEMHSRKARKGWVTSGAELPAAAPAKSDDFLVQQSAGKFYLTHAGAAALAPTYGVKRGAEIFRAGAMAMRLVELAAGGAGRVPKKLIRILEAAHRRGQRGLTKRRTA